MIARNLFANALGSAWTAVASFVFVPVYLHYIGVEGYGLIGFFAVITSFVGILDGGISAMVSRELSPLTAVSPRSERIAALELVRSLQVVLWALAALVAVVLWLLAPCLAEGWLKPHSISVSEASVALRWMSLAFLMQWPCSLCCGCLIALQRQVRLNALNSLIATLRFGGAALVLWAVSPTLEAFFIWQVIASALAVLLLSFNVRSVLRVRDVGPKAGWCSIARLRMSGRFAGGVAGINLLALILTQLDKVLLSALLSLESFGVYSLASTMASAIYKLSGPVYFSLYPRFFQLVAGGEREVLRNVFRKAYQLMALAVVPAAVVLASFADVVLAVWTQNLALAEQGRWALAVLTLGSMLNATMWLPYALQLAHQWVRLGFFLNLAMVVMLVPLVFVLTARFDLLGGAMVWLLLNLVYVLVGASITLRRLLPGELVHWYAKGLLQPLLICAGVCALARWFWQSEWLALPVWSTAYVCIVGLACVGLCLLSVPELMRDIRARLGLRVRAGS